MWRSRCKREPLHRAGWGFSSEGAASRRALTPVWHRQHAGLILTLTYRRPERGRPACRGHRGDPGTGGDPPCWGVMARKRPHHTSPSICRGSQRAAFKRANMSGMENMLCNTFLCPLLQTSDIYIKKKKKQHLLTAAWIVEMSSQTRGTPFFHGTYNRERRALLWRSQRSPSFVMTADPLLAHASYT